MIVRKLLKAAIYIKVIVVTTLVTIHEPMASPLPAYCKTALLLCVNYAAVYGSDGINMPGCGFYELHIRIPCLRSLRERWA